MAGHALTSDAICSGLIVGACLAYNNNGRQG